MNQIIVVGAGASGMAAAICAAEQGAKVTVLEKNTKPGKKLLATGNGRCNLCNVSAPRYYGQTDFALKVLSNMSAARMLGTLERWGLATVQEDGGRVYPASGQAQTVMDVLSVKMAETGVRLVTESEVTGISCAQGMFSVETVNGQYTADKCILSTGGLAGGRLGCELSSYDLPVSQGHRLNRLSPALTPLMTDRAAVRGLAGLRVPAIVTLMSGKTPISASQGEILFADYGISGICVMQLASDTEEALRTSSDVWLNVDFSPLIGLCKREYRRLELSELTDRTEQIRALLNRRLRLIAPQNLLTGLLPGALCRRLEGTRPGELPYLLTHFPLTIKGVRSFENAQVTHGGIDTRDVDPNTMQSARCPGLYLTGEVLDVDGDCGGFNLLFAFSSGMLAGSNAAK